MKNLEPLKYFLDLEVARNPTSIFLCQRKYALEIISETGLFGARPISTSMEPNRYLASIVGPVFAFPDCYRYLISKLIYLSFTRSELTYDMLS